MTPCLSRGADHAEHNRSPTEEANGHADLRGVWPAGRLDASLGRCPYPAICAGCDEVLDTRAAVADVTVQVDGAPASVPALTAEDLERRQVDPEYDNWLRRQGR